MQAINIAYPLKGQWQVPVSPADRVPSHYTHKFGLGYAFDFIKDREPASQSLISKLFKSQAVNTDKGWAQEVFSPVDGIIKTVSQITPDRPTISLLSNVKSSIKAMSFNPKKSGFETLFGNYIVIEFNGIFCLLAHLQFQSIKLSVGQELKQGELVGCIGHNGSSHGPHLHLQLMDKLDLTQAQGLPCAFKEYEELQSETWVKVTNKTPNKDTPTRFE